MNTYLLLMSLGTILLFVLYGLRCACAVHQPALRKNAWTTALLSLLLSAVFGVVLSRVCYALLMQELDFEYDGAEALWQLLELDAEHMSFFFGAVGVCLGTLLANRLLRRNAVLAGVDAFAPFGALLVALFRIGEAFLGSLGTGASLPEGSPLAFFPFALNIQVDGGYSYWGWAVFALSAAFALLWSAVSFCMKKSRPGLTITATLFFLCLTQVLCESLRHRGMFWLFVHTEQVLCMVVVVAVLIGWLVKARDHRPWLRQLLPLIITTVCIGLLVATEFAIDGKLFDLPHPVCYTFMTVMLAVIGGCGWTAAHRWNIFQSKH